MFNRLKEAISSKASEEDPETIRKRIPDLSFLSNKDVEQYKRITLETKENIQQLGNIIKDNISDIKQFIRDQKQTKKQSPKEDNEEGEVFTFEEDLKQVQTLLSDVIMNISKLHLSNQEIKDRVRNIGAGEAPQKVKEMQELIRKYEVELKQKQTSQENNKDIMTTLKHQTQLLTKQTKDLQQKCFKLEKQLAEKTSLLTNLQEQKKVLLELRNNESDSINPEVELLKNQLQQADKKLTIQRTKVQQKQKQIQTLKKKMEEDRDSLEKIADQLKEKELKSKKIIDKYERSKAQIRKYREEKTEFIKKLNLQIANLTEKAQKTEAQNLQLKEQVKRLNEKNQLLQAQVSKNEGKTVDLDSARTQLKQLRQQQIALTTSLSEKQQENAQLKIQVEQLHNKRKSLLQALEKPINHQIRTLDKIIRALEKLYKQYIEVVFTQGNIIGFENRISYILSNVCEIKQDLKL